MRVQRPCHAESMQTEQKPPLQCIKHQLTHINVVDDGKSLVIPSSSDHAVPLQPAKRPTRQWAAWTREEEESFFTALRQVGKNFEKITCRVQSKNKDQVRHYYYRLVRRMNKLLGPGLCLDAKNSKDTNAAMLHWWSLLEKYSCKASKLHLKPRRFKLFIEALEHQLLKDRKKNVRKRSSQGENCSPASSTFPNQNKLSPNDVRAVKTVLADSQIIQRGGQGKRYSTRRNLNMGVSRNSNKEESFPTKPTRQRRRTGAVSAAAIKRWEKAAIAGVSLVADAAEHLERTGGVEANHQGGLNVLSVQAVGSSMERADSSPLLQVQSHLLNLTKSIAIENNVQTAVKLKLQLFPIDESTRKALEVDKHNPHLELTLGTRKKISSVLEHLDRKWGSSSAAAGELMLFPFFIQRENFLGCQSWTKDSVVTAAEVYAMSGSPPVFRLRYGWILSTELQPAASEKPRSAEEKNRLEKHIIHFSSNHQTSESLKCSVKESMAAVAGEKNKCVNDDPHNMVLESSNAAARNSAKRIKICDVSTSRKTEKMVDQGIRDTPTLSAGEWADSLTNVSVGDLLADVSDRTGDNCVDAPLSGSSHCREEIPFTCDSFDAAIAAHISNQNKIVSSGLSSHSSIWDAEETCDAFSFQKRAVVNKLVTQAEDTVREDPMVTAVVAGEGMATTSLAGSGCKDQLLQEEAMAEDTVQGDPVDECTSEPEETENSAKIFSSLTDIYWPDSLGPLELDVPSCKYYSEDLILSDSLSGLNRLIASSLDAFQNCPFFGLDEKGPSSSAVGVQRGVSFAGRTATGGNGVQSLQA